MKNLIHNISCFSLSILPRKINLLDGASSNTTLLRQIYGLVRDCVKNVFKLALWKQTKKITSHVFRQKMCKKIHEYLRRYEIDQPDSPKTVFQRQFSNTGMEWFCGKVLKMTESFGQTKCCISAPMTSKAKYYIFKLTVLSMYFSKVKRNS